MWGWKDAEHPMRGPSSACDAADSSSLSAAGLRRSALGGDPRVVARGTENRSLLADLGGWVGRDAILFVALSLRQCLGG